MDPPVEVYFGSAKGGEPAKKVEEVGGQNAGETQVAGATRETVLIVDDEPAA